VPGRYHITPLCVSSWMPGERKRELERGKEWVVKVRVNWGKRARNCFHYKETEWRFYGCEISQAAPYSACKYRLQGVQALRREDSAAIRADCHGRAGERKKAHFFTSVLRYHIEYIWSMTFRQKFDVVRRDEWQECGVTCHFAIKCMTEGRRRKHCTDGQVVGTSWCVLSSRQTLAKR
jgi:hypothetical protein